MRDCTGSKCPLQTTAMNVTTKILSCTDRVWRRSINVGMDKEGYSKDVAHDPGENPQRMAVAPSILPLAPTTSTCGTMGVIPIFNIPNKPSTRPDATGPNGLPETFQMENVSIAKQA